MKTRVFRYVLLMSWVIMLLTPVSAQVQNPLLDNPRYGADRETREECLKQTSFYQEFYKQKNYKDARSGWAIVYKICPQSSQNVYIRGVRMLKMDLERTEDPAQKAVLVDSLMRIYDKRIKYFGHRGTILQMKGLDLLAYTPDKKEEISNLLMQSMELQKGETDPVIIPIVMQLNTQLYMEKARTPEQMLDLYSKLSAVMTQISEKVSKPEDREKVQAIAEQLDSQFTSLGVAKCEDLVAIFEPKFKERPEDVELARAICNQLTMLHCTDEEIYVRAATLIFQKDPSTMLGVELARSFAQKRENSKADDYFKRSIALEKDSMRRSQLLVEYASFIATNLVNMPQARSVAYEALKYNKNQGYAYMLIASLYAGTRNCGASNIDNRSVYWAAVDKYQQAKTVDPALAQECNKQIAYLTQMFPLNEEIFFQDLQKGQTFTVPCWINEKTVVRSRD